MQRKVAAAISGGIDSLYTAYLLKRDGYTVTGIHFDTGYSAFALPDARHDEHPSDRVIIHGKTDKGVSAAMGMIADQLDIPIHIVDLSGMFETQVVDYFTDAYLKGQTPNPCLRCNPLIKFGALMDFARSMHIQTIATGHYVKTREDDQGCMHLHQGADTSKDQAYFLAFLSQQQLKNTVFPLGEITKQAIRNEVDRLNLKPVTPEESQDICFIQGDYKTFLEGRPGFQCEPGPIRNHEGKRIGTHNGLHSFTIGQRRGINCPAAYPYYVIGLNTDSNTLIVGPKETLLTDHCRVRETHWINPPAAFPVTLTTRIRYTHKGTLSTLTRDDSGMIHVAFHEPVSSVTPGQGAVFYVGDEVLGGGWIV